MNALKFIGKSVAMYLVGAAVIDIPIHFVLKKCKDKNKEGKSYTSACGFEVEDDSWRNEEGEILVRGFTR